MKLSYLAHSKIPSKEANSVHVMKMCQALAVSGADVNLYIPEHNASSEDPFQFYGVKQVFSIKRKKWKRITFGNFVYALKVVTELVREKEQVVYGRDLVSCYVATLFGLRTIWEAHAPVQYMGKLYEWLFKRMTSRKNYIKTVVISSTLKEHFADTYGLNNNVVVLPDCSDAIDLDSVKPKFSNESSFKANVGYIGQLYPGKGMEIISELVPLCPDIMFHIVGGVEKDVMYWQRHLSSCNNVVFHGFVKPSDTVSYGLAMDILIAPYLSKVQGAGSKDFRKNISMWMSPLKIFEYMSYKKPIVCSDLQVIRDVLNNNNSILCSPDNIDDWKNAVYLLANNKEEAQRISDNAYKDFINNYTWNHRAKSILELYS